MEGTIEQAPPGEGVDEEPQAVGPSWGLLEAIHAPANYDEYLSSGEAAQIQEQFRANSFEPGRQVMWSDVPREWVQTWADENHLQTLSTAMGPLMLKYHGRCLKSKKSKEQWTQCIKGASRIFALYVPKGHEVTVLTRPPPNKFHPMGLSTYQSVEEPILKGMEGGEPLSRIDLVHLTVANASDFRYQIWPEDRTHLWIDRYKLHELRKHYRRTAKRYVDIVPMRCRRRGI